SLFLSILFIATLLAGAAAEDGIVVNAPTAAQPARECEPFEITWTGGSAPYKIQVIRPMTTPQSLGEIVLIADHVTGTSHTWIVAFDAGVSLVFTLEDAIGGENLGGGSASDPFIVAPGAGSSCLPGVGSASQSPTSITSNAVS
ncbi:hypothetical protein FB45DRAFT_1080683, partial [Roridomyces roridus]